MALILPVSPQEEKAPDLVKIDRRQARDECPPSGVEAPFVRESETQSLLLLSTEAP